MVVGRMARWMLLACTLFGLAAMHTLSHAGMRMDNRSHASAGPAAAMDPAADITAAVAAVADDCPGCAHTSGPAGPGHGGMPGWSVCPVVLTALAVLVLLAALLLARSGPGRCPARIAAVRLPSSRGPPRPAGLTLAAVSVLRI